MLSAEWIAGIHMHAGENRVTMTREARGRLKNVSWWWYTRLQLVFNFRFLCRAVWSAAMRARAEKVRNTRGRNSPFTIGAHWTIHIGIKVKISNYSRMNNDFIARSICFYSFGRFLSHLLLLVLLLCWRFFYMTRRVFKIRRGVLQKKRVNYLAILK